MTIPTCPPAFPVPAGLPEPAIREARRHVDRCIAGRLDDAGVRWLYERPMLWLMALDQFIADINWHIDKGADEVRSLAPTDGEQPSGKYLRVRRTVAAENVGRLHVLGIARRHRDEVVSLLGATRVGDLLPGADAVTAMHTIVRMCRQDDEVGEIQQVAEQFLTTWSAPLPTAQVP